MSEFNEVNLQDNQRGEALLAAFTKAREVFDEEDALEEEAAQLFGIPVDDIRSGNMPHKVENWMIKRFKQAGWSYKK